MSLFLQTPRLIMRPPVITDLDDLYLLQSDPDVMKYIGDGVRTKEQVQEWLIKSIEHHKKHGFSFCSVFEKDSGLLIGQAGLIYLAYDDTQQEIELGYRLRKLSWGKGYATELAQALIAWGFTNLQVEKIVAVINPINNSSRKVLEKAGMSHVGQIKYFDSIVPKFEIYRK